MRTVDYPRNINCITDYLSMNYTVWDTLGHTKCYFTATGELKYIKNKYYQKKTSVWTKNLEDISVFIKSTAVIDISTQYIITTITNKKKPEPKWNNIH